MFAPAGQTTARAGLRSKLAALGGSVEVSHISGGQPVYYYMISVE